MSRPVTVVCISSFLKGARLLKAAKAAGAHVILITLDELAEADWPRDAIDEFFHMPDIHRQPDITNAVAFLARHRRIDRIVALDEYDTVTAAQLREHLRIPGLGETTGRHFRDKLAMRVEARDTGIPVPEFVHVLNYDDLRDFMGRVPGPWLLKPRTEASAMGIRRIESPEQLWPILEHMGDGQSNFLMESFVPGDVFHVDSIVTDSEIQFSCVSVYGQPPLEVYQGGGVFLTKTVDPADPVHNELTEMNRALLKSFGMVRGATHAEFIRSRADGKPRFLEVAARVGGANIDLLVEAATGVNMWEEWARVEIAHARGEAYSVMPTRAQHAALMVCLAKEARPDMDSFQAPEIFWRLRKRHHAGLIVASPDRARVEQVTAETVQRFATEFLATAPPLNSASEMSASE